MWTAEHRRAANRSGLRYPSDLTDAEWALVEPMIPPARHGGRKRSVHVREVFERDTLRAVDCHKSTQDLMRHRRPAAGPTADGAAHGPAHGSPSTASARVIRGDKVRPPPSDRGLRSPRTGGATDAPAAQRQQCSAAQDEGSDSNSARR